MADRPIRIQRRRTRGWRMSDGAIYVGRPSKWGNPFLVGQVGMSGVRRDEIEVRPTSIGAEFFVDGRRGIPIIHFPRPLTIADVLGYYRAHIIETVGARIIRAELGGADLCCWCPLVDKDGNPVPCHADVLLELANA